MSENNQMMSLEGQLVGMPLAGPESFSQQQLEYLKRAMGVDETVLWEDSDGAFSATLSESLFNFTKIKVFESAGASSHVQEIYTSDIVSTNTFCVGAVYKALTSTQACMFASVWTISNNGTQLDAPDKGIGVAAQSGSVQYYGNNQYHGKIRRVIGVGRISGGNT